MAPFLYEKIPLTDYHVGNPSTGFSVEPLFFRKIKNADISTFVSYWKL